MKISDLMSTDLQKKVDKVKTSMINGLGSSGMSVGGNGSQRGMLGNSFRQNKDELKFAEKHNRTSAVSK